MNYKIISCYTENTGYEQEAEKLKKTMRKFGLDTSYVLPFESRGNWEQNCIYKATFILEILQKISTPVVWLDSDARIYKSPDLFDSITEDIGLFYLKGKILAGSVMYWAPHKICFKILKRWIKESQQNKYNFKIVIEQSTLSKIIEQTPKLKVHRLPDEYCTIDKFVKITKDMVIYQTQASRRLKKTINGKRRIVKKNN